MPERYGKHVTRAATKQKYCCIRHFMARLLARNTTPSHDVAKGAHKMHRGCEVKRKKLQAKVPALSEELNKADHGKRDI